MVGDLSTACRDLNIGFGIYLSPADLHEQTHGRDSDKYNDFFCHQLRELLTGYGEICEVFFDGAEVGSRKQRYDWQRYYRLIRELQPGAAIVVKGPDARWVGNEYGEGRESDWNVVPLPVPADQYDWPDMTWPDVGGKTKIDSAQYLHWYPALADVSIRSSWFWRADPDSAVKTVPMLVRLYETTVGRNAVMQLGVAPNREGVIPELEVQRLGEFGEQIRQRFATNLILSAKVESLDPSPKTTNTFAQKISFKIPTPVKYVVLQELIEMGQHVERFEIKAQLQSGESRKFKATTIGYKRIIRIDLANVTDIEVQVLESRAQPRVLVAVY